ncbi:TPA: hypothetical protein QCV71_005944, partial [Bacillus cereus]|nr:hypothetical protein [Bacillus cereus]
WYAISNVSRTYDALFWYVVLGVFGTDDTTDSQTPQMIPHPVLVVAR